jgi:hypothetical protein
MAALVFAARDDSRLISYSPGRREAPRATISRFTRRMAHPVSAAARRLSPLPPARVKLLTAASTSHLSRITLYFTGLRRGQKAAHVFNR